MIVRSHAKLERGFLLFGSGVLAVAMLYWAQAVFIPLTIAILLTFILIPLVSLLQRWGLPRLAAIVIVAVLMFVVLGGIIDLFFTQMKSLGEKLPEYKTQIEGKISGLREATTESWIVNFLDFMNEMTKIATRGGDVETKSREPIPVKMEPSLLPTVQSVAGTLFHSMIHVILVVILVFFMLHRREDIRNRIIRLWGHDNLHNTTRALDDASQRVSRFLFFQFFLNIGFGFVFAVGLFFIGIPYAFIWGALTAVLRYVPYIGAWASAFFPLVFSLVIPGWTPFFLVITYFVLLELIHSNVIEPLVFGHSIGVSGVALLVAAMFWTWLWGPLGLVLSTPLTACLYVFGHYVPGFSSITLLLGDEPVLEKEVHFYQRLLARDSEEAEDLIEDYLKDNPVEKVYDDVLVPTLLLARKDRKNENLSDEEEGVILKSIRDICYDVVLPTHWKMEAPLANGEAPPVRLKVFGLAVRDDTDALVLEMIKEVLDPEKFHYQSITSKIFQEGLAAEVGKEAPAVIVLVTLSGANLLRTRTLCKKFRSKFADSKIIVGCCGLEENVSVIREKLKAEGADAVGSTFVETCDLVNATSAHAETENGEPAAVLGAGIGLSNLHRVGK